MMERSPTVVGENMRRLRIEAGKSAEDVARALNCTGMQIYNYEKGRTRITEDIITRFCHFLEISVDKLFEWRK